MSGRFISLIIAASLAVTGMTAAPARADDKDVARALAAIAGIAIIGAAIHENKKKRRHDPYVSSRSHGHKKAHRGHRGHRKAHRAHRGHRKAHRAHRRQQRLDRAYRKGYRTHRREVRQRRAHRRANRRHNGYRQHRYSARPRYAH